jgi:Cu+-exporting ATPase
MKTKITIEGMHCASCASNVERALGKLKGVESASVSVMTRKALVESSSALDNKEVEKAVSKVGYKVVNIE